ncbi:MAG: MFS transporter [Elusimicrobia bacterium]|nr:MFS transporter [Elusimicrobiota bacterium]
MQTPFVSAHPALVTATSRLTAASAPDKPASDAKRVSDEVFSGETPRRPSDEAPVPGRYSSSPSLSPASAPLPAKKPPLIARWRSAMSDGSGPLVLAAFAWNFLTIAAYSIIGPARGALLMTKFGPDTIPWVYMASAALTGAVVFAYGRFSRAPRKLLIGGSLAMLAATLVAGAFAVSATALPSVAFGYFLWTDVFGIMSATLFWTYANDVFTRDESKRVFGFLAAGAPLGSIAGAFLMKMLVGSMGPIPMLMVAAGIFAAVLPIFFFMESRSKGRGASPAPQEAAPAPAKGILKTILGSPFLIFLTVVVALERLVPDITNYLYSFAASAAYKGDPAGMAQMFANVNFYTSLASFTASSLLVGLTLRKIGTGGSLMTAGLVNLALFAVFPFMPTLGVAAVFFGLDGVTRYTWFKTAKESTYAATDRDTIYRVKAFIEMFVYRFARGLAGLLLLGVAWLQGGPTGAALLGIPLALLWLYASWRMGREHKKLEAANDAGK